MKLRQNLAPGLVDTEHPWRSREPDNFEMPQQRVDELRVAMRRPTNGVAHTNHIRRLAATL